MIGRGPRTSFASVLTSLENKTSRTGRPPPCDAAPEVLLATSLPLRILGQEGLRAWDVASDWAQDLVESTGLEGGRRHQCDPEVIAGELALGPEMGVDELKARRRAFMWQNHPDRASHVGVAVATVRVAVANMLFDAALARARARDGG